MYNDEGRRIDFVQKRSMPIGEDSFLEWDEVVEPVKLVPLVMRNEREKDDQTQSNITSGRDGDESYRPRAITD